jgi:hypothetical protein
MPVLLGFALGFILKAVGPGLVVPAMFKLQKTGLGRDQGARGAGWGPGEPNPARMPACLRWSAQLCGHGCGLRLRHCGLCIYWFLQACG